MTSNVLVRGFFDDPVLEEYTDMLICANNFSISNGYWNNEIYPLRYEMTNEKSEKCKDSMGAALFVDFILKGITLQIFNRSCSISVLKQTFLVTLRTILLMEVELTNDQKTQEKISFVENIHQIMENILICTSQPAEKVYNPLEEMIESVMEKLIHGMFKKVGENVKGLTVQI